VAEKVNAGEGLPEIEPPTHRLQEFLEVGEILSSPLTRAVQTAILGLHGHPRCDSVSLD